MDGKEQLGTPVNVPAPDVSAEELAKQVRRLHAEGMTKFEIARVTGLDRTTVRTCLRKSEWQPYRREAPQVLFSARPLFQEFARRAATRVDTTR